MVEVFKIYKKQIQAYDDDEAKTFFEGLLNEHPKVRALLLTSLLLGLRRGEVVGLMWSDIDFKNNCLTVNRSAYKIKGQPQSVKMPKSKNSIRIVYFPEIYAEALREWMEVQDRDRRAAGRGWKEQGFVEADEAGFRLTESGIDIDSKDLQNAKAVLPILFTEFGISTDSKDLQPQKA